MPDESRSFCTIKQKTINFMVMANKKILDEILFADRKKKI
jgi:hypothetical protein